MTIQSLDGRIVKVFLPNACESPQKQKTTKVVFHRYGAQYFLAQIWTNGNNQGEELPTSGLEAEVARTGPTQNVVVAATLR